MGRHNVMGHMGHKSDYLWMVYFGVAVVDWVWMRGKGEGEKSTESTLLVVI